MQQPISNSHRYSHYAGQTLEWLDSDDYNWWRQNMRNDERRSVLEQNGWDKPGVITYTMNSHGFRTHEFGTETGYIALGCSFTAGIGLPNHQIWPTIVENTTGTRVWNLGIGGCAMDTCFRLLYNHITTLNIAAVLLLRPSPLRCETHYNDKIEVFMPNGHSDPSLDTIKKYWYSDTQNQVVNAVKNTLAMQALCNERGIKLVVKDADIFTHSTDKFPGARDLMHSGHTKQQNFAQLFIDELNQN